MNEGYIKIHRKLISWEWYTDLPTKSLFLHCLLMANYTDKKWRGNDIKRGTFITSFDQLAIHTGLTKQQVRTASKKLVSTHEITHETTSQFSLITVTNYNDYQLDKTGKQHTDNTPSTNDQQTDNIQITPTKEVKKVNKVKKKVEYDLPLFVNIKLWGDFLEVRKSKKAVHSNAAIKLLLNDLIKFEDKKAGNANLAIENSIKNSWKGVFEPKDQITNTNKPINIHTSVTSTTDPNDMGWPTDENRR